MSRQFTQSTGSVAIETNKQSIARDFGVKETEVTYFNPGDSLFGFKVIYNPTTQRAYSLPADIASGTTAISLSTAAILVHSAGTVDLGALAASRNEFVTLPGSFSTGATINVKNENLEYQGELFRWRGALPKVIPAGSTPASVGGTGSNAWGSVEDGSQARTLALTVQLRGNVANNTNLDTYGPTDAFVGTWSQPTAANATLAAGYPAAGEAGLFEVFKANRNSGMQRYTSDNGRIFIRYLSAAWNGTNGPWASWVEVGALSSNKPLSDQISLSDSTAFAQSTTYIVSGSRTDLPAGVNTNSVITSWRRAGGVTVGLNQMLFTNLGIYERRGAPNIESGWTTVNWYTGGDANGWRLMGMDALSSIGLGVSTSALASAFDWQQVDFVVGSLQVVLFSVFRNTPAAITYASTTTVTVEALQARGTTWVVKLTPLTTTLGNKREYTVTINGAKGSRTFQVTENFNSDNPVPVTAGGHGSTTPEGARINLELNTRIIPDNKNINEIGPSLEGRWSKSTSSDASITTGYPEDLCVGYMDVTAGGQFGGTQRYTSRSGNIYVRSLTASWNGKDGPWSDWRSTQMAIRPLLTTLNLNTLGNLRDTGIWKNSSGTLATAALNFPVEGGDGLGILEVFEGGRFNVMQRFTNYVGRIFVRSLTANWNGTDGPWSTWSETNDRRGNANDTNLNVYGPNHIGSWSCLNSTYATAANNYPVDGSSGIGLLEVHSAGNVLMQRYTSRYGRMFSRTLTTASWNGTDGPWSSWVEIGTGNIVLIPSDAVSLSDPRYFYGNVVYTVNVAMIDNPVDIAGNTASVIISYKRSYVAGASLNQYLMVPSGRIYYRSGSLITSNNAWTAVSWYGGDANGWKEILTTDSIGPAFGIGGNTPIKTLDFNAYDFKSGETFYYSPSAALNIPAGLVWNANVGVSCHVLFANDLYYTLLLSGIGIAGTERTYLLKMRGAPGTVRTYTVSTVSESGIPLEIANGGTGGRTPFDARVGLELNTRTISNTQNLNDFGPSLEGRWTKATTTGATLENGFPEDGVTGVLDVIIGGQFGGTQRFTTNAGVIYTRSLTAAWNGTNGPWSGWITPYEAAPFPDVWLPLNDSMTMLAGNGPFDRITVGNLYAELSTRSATFARASTATYIDKSGVLQKAEINEPRFEKEGLLIEGPGTNHVLFSGDGTKWRSSFVDDVGITQTNMLAPDGVSQAVKVSFLTTNEVQATISGNVASWGGFTTGGYVSTSFFVKPAERSIVQIVWPGSSVGVATTYANFDLINMTMKGTCFSYEMQKVAGGWVRCTATAIIDGDFTGANTIGAWIGIINTINDTRRPFVSGVVGEGVYLWGAQMEPQKFISSYIPTSSVAASRAGETVNIPPSGNVGYIRSDEGFNRTVSFEVSVNKFNLSATNYVTIAQISGVGNNDILFRQYSDRILTYRGVTSLTINTVPEFSRKIFTHTTDVNNNVAIYFNGRTVSRSAPPLPTDAVPTTINFGSNGGAIYHIRNFRIWHQLLTNSQIKGLR